MQNAKDSFYMALRTRLAAINPERTILLRGAVRPGILVEEAEAPFSQLPNDVFVLRWLGLGADMDLASTMAAEECEILYQTCGTQSFGGLDRGRALSEMDEELVAMLAAFLHAQAELHGNAAGGDADAGVLGRASVCADRSAAGSVEPVSQGDGLQLPGAGGVNGGELVFSSRAGGEAGARIFCAGESRGTNAGALRSRRKQGGFSLDAPPAPWISLGWIQEFARKPASKTTPVLTGIPAGNAGPGSRDLEAQVSLQFLSWTKLTMALATGSQHMNLLAPASGAAAAADGAQAAAAVIPQSGSTATSILLAAADAAKFSAGSIIAVDVDYTGQTGFVGTPVAGAYVRQALTDVDYIRRVTFNVALVSQVTSAGLTLAEPLPGGAPAAGAKLQAVTGICGPRGRQLLPGVVGAVRDAGQPGRENLLLLSAAADDERRGRNGDSAGRQA